MNNHHKNRIDALLISTLASQKQSIQDAFRKRHGRLIDKQSYLIVEAKLREHRTWHAMTKIIDSYFSKDVKQKLKAYDNNFKLN